MDFRKRVVFCKSCLHVRIEGAWGKLTPEEALSLRVNRSAWWPWHRYEVCPNCQKFIDLKVANLSSE